MKSIFIAAALILGAATSHAQNTNQTRFEDKSFWKKLAREISLGYYFSLMGPSPALPADQTYNVFLEDKGPQQTFHSLNLRWQFAAQWAMGITLSGVHHHTSPVKTEQGFINDNNRTMFDSRVYLAVPSIDIGFAYVFNNFALEVPTTPISRDNEMKFGMVLSQTISVRNMPKKFSTGWLTQLIRYEYKRSTLPPPFVGGLSTPLQTTLLTTGPYLNYQLAEQWQIASILSFDWDQRGNQTDTLEFNNNLPDRFRLALNYFFKTKPFTHVGIYTQTNTKPRDDNTIVGLDFSLLF
jgi:hypothetical protein